MLQRLDSEQLTELYVDLKLQDKLELEAKKHRADNSDKIGKFAGEASKKMAGKPQTCHESIDFETCNTGVENLCVSSRFHTISGIWNLTSPHISNCYTVSC